MVNLFDDVSGCAKDGEQVHDRETTQGSGLVNARLNVICPMADQRGKSTDDEVERRRETTESGIQRQEAVPC